MGFYLLMALPLALGWMIVTSQFNPDGLLIGYVLSLLALLFIRPPVEHIVWGRLPAQFVALVVYILTLFRDIFLSSIYVVRLVLAPRLDLNPGILRVPTQDSEQRETTAALSAHNITITPGELVVEFEENDAMLVHTLDVTTSSASAERNQARRLGLIRRILTGDAT
ncbi:MAG: Na+/H+ antiporter subunit E [Chloroflexota bacterium]|nr:Na+/H+ antiporter subunit E [Chloroflexota bacterium]